MRKLIFLIPLIFACCICLGQTSQEWQSDLRYLQQTVHTKYNNLFYNISSSDWDKLVDSFYTQIPQLEKEKIIVGFMHVLSVFHIGHTQVDGNALASATNSQFSRLPLQLYSFSDGVFITAVDKQYKEALGGKVTKVGSTSITDAIEALRPVASYESEPEFRDQSLFYLPFPQLLRALEIENNVDEVPITYIKGGKEVTTVFKPNNVFEVGGWTGLTIPKGWVSAKNESRLPLWQKEPSSFRYMEYLPETKTLYVRHSVTYDEDTAKTISAFFNAVGDFLDKNDVQKLVLDVRMNGGGNGTLNPPIITNIIKSRNINQKGKLFCIIGRRTFSAAQLLINALELYTPVTFVGEPSGENVSFWGDFRNITLPNSKLPVKLSWVWWQHSPPPVKRKTTNPLLAADMSFDDYQKGIDPAMKIINSTNNVVIIEEEVKNLFKQDKVGEASALLDEYIKDPLHKYINEELEAKLNNAGYVLLNNWQYEKANKLFGLIVKAFPESANAYDSYAESFMKIGEKDEAIKNYEIAIAKDKIGITSQGARKKIEKIRNGN